MPSLPYDLTEDGAPCVFADGPKAGHTGTVTPQGGVLPTSLSFLGGRLRYTLGRRRTVRGFREGKPVSFRGVEYVMDPRCSVAVLAAKADEEANAMKGLQA